MGVSNVESRAVDGKVMRRRVRGVAWLLAVGLVLGSCGDDADSGGDADGASDPAVAADGAVLDVLEPGVDVADEPADLATAEFRAGQDGEPLVVSDVVRTDPSGFAEVAWFEGALARVDADSTYSLTTFDATPGQAVVVTELETGRIWNRLREGAASTYEVRTDVGTAAVRGTAFWVACNLAGACTFAVLEGTVVVRTNDGSEILLGPGEEVTIGSDGTPGGVIPTDTEDAWVARNAGLDTGRGFASLSSAEGSSGGDEGSGTDGDPVPDDPEAVLAALLRAGEAERQRDNISSVYELWLTEHFPCQAQVYVEVASDALVPPYHDAAAIDAAVEQGNSLDTMTVDVEGLGSEFLLASIDGAVECYGSLREAEVWDGARDLGNRDASGQDMLSYMDCILSYVEPTEEELQASLYYWYYDGGGTDGPLATASDYYDLSDALRARVHRAHSDSQLTDGPCTQPW